MNEFFKFLTAYCSLIVVARASQSNDNFLNSYSAQKMLKSNQNKQVSPVDRKLDGGFQTTPMEFMGLAGNNQNGQNFMNNPMALGAMMAMHPMTNPMHPVNNPMMNPMHPLNPISPANPINLMTGDIKHHIIHRDGSLTTIDDELNSVDEDEEDDHGHFSKLKVQLKCDNVKTQAVEIANEIMKRQNKLVFKELMNYLLKSKFLIGMTEIKLTRILRKKIFGLLHGYSSIDNHNVEFIESKYNEMLDGELPDDHDSDSDFDFDHEGGDSEDHDDYTNVSDEDLDEHLSEEEMGNQGSPEFMKKI